VALIQEEAVEQLLLQEWSTDLRLTTIPQAMERLGMADRLSVRWRVAKRLEALWRNVLTSPGKREQISAALGRPLDEAREERWRQQVSTWQLASILLTEGEKLVARHILMRHNAGWPLPRPIDIARTLNLSVRAVRKGLLMLARLGFLSIQDRRRPANYSLAEGYQQVSEGLGFSFHTVTLNTGERFGVP